MPEPSTNTSQKALSNADLQAVMPKQIAALLAREPALEQALPLESPVELPATSIERIAAMFERYSARPCLGVRDYKIVEDAAGDKGTTRMNYLPAFRTHTFGQVWQRVQSVASGWRALDMVQTGDFVGILGFGSPDWIISDFACLYLGAVCVQLQTTMAHANLQDIIKQTDMRCLVISQEMLSDVTALLPACPSVRSVMVVDATPGDTKLTQQACALVTQLRQQQRVEWMDEVLAKGHTNGHVPMVVPGRDTADADPLLSLTYTSGSTGSPKGAMFPESVYVQNFAGSVFTRGEIPPIPSVGLSYLPLNHLAGHFSILASLLVGGHVNFTHKSDMSSLFEDIQLTRPTFLMLVPRVAEMIYQHYREEVARGHDAGAVLLAMRQKFLGDRLVYAVCGSAPLSPEIVQFLRDCFQIPIFDAYGSTETSSVTFEHRIDRSCVTDYKLTDVPELGYHTSDKPYPRGELRVKSTRLVHGYFKSPEATAELRDSEGFLKTGDIVEEHGPDHLICIDRAKNILKLSHGEFVSVSRLEGLFTAGSPTIEQIFIYGNSSRSYLLGVIVPSASMRHHPDARKVVHEEIKRIAGESGLHGYEVPRDFLLADAPFTKENHFLTESNKPSRPHLRAAFGPQLEELYDSIESRRVRELGALADGKWDNVSIAAKVQRAVASTLGIDEAAVRQTSENWYQLGGDSLAATRLRDLIKELCGVALPVGSVLDRASNVATLIAQVEALAAHRGDASLFAQAHGDGAQVIHAKDLRINRFLPESFLSAVPKATAASRPRCVLLTGANGFLGRFLTEELLRRLPKDGQLICVVRATGDAAARQRLLRELDFLGNQAASWVESGRLRVLAGDLMQPNLGLSAHVYSDLTHSVDAIMHNGALVNHVLSYAELFEPNVLGTVALIRLALTGRRKSFNFVSTVGVLAEMQSSSPIGEDTTATQLWQERPVDGGYAVGYGTSKWACEVLLQDLLQTYDVPVTIFRCGMILAHTHHRGQINATDLFTRLLHSIVHTGIAPESFYAHASGPRAHFDGTPVDMIAAGLAATSLQAPDGFHIYHAINPNYDDGVSLDTVTDWIESAGYNVQRMASYPAWLQAFTRALQDLPEDEQRQSALPILHQWKQQANGDTTTKLDGTQFMAQLSRLTPWTSTVLTETFIHTCLNHMVARGIIPLPSSSSGIPANPSLDNCKNPQLTIQ